MERLRQVGRIQPQSAAQLGWSRLGVGFEKLDRYAFDPNAAYDQVAQLGVHYVRIQSGWQRTERAEGVYDFAWLDDIVDNIIARGQEP
ncbi:MAG: beta-galactosidase, partial [bacterium]|nr:beta-galactosidase [bacterium]